MGSSETDKSSKDPKTTTPPPASTQDQSSATSTGAANPEWSGFQAYSPMPQGFLASSPQAHPYMWSVQPVMPPYGTPPHAYMAMYPHGVYAHPSMPPGSYPYSPYAVPPASTIPEASGNTPGSMDVDGKPPEGKEKLPFKRSKGSLGSLNMITGKKHEQGKAKEPLANGAYSKSGESASDGSSEGSDVNSHSANSLTYDVFRARAVFEEKMLESSRQKTQKQLESSRQKTKKHTLQTYNSRFETLDDFGDDDVEVDASAATLSEKISQALNMNKERNKKRVSGDEDLPQRESFRERQKRWRKDKIRALSRARDDSVEGGDIEDDGENAAEGRSLAIPSEHEKMKVRKVKGQKRHQEESVSSQRAVVKEKLKQKGESSGEGRSLAIRSEPETVDGKLKRRPITREMEMNRGLTRYRSRRKKYKTKPFHEIEEMRMAGAPYSGEIYIDDTVIRSIKLGRLG